MNPENAWRLETPGAPGWEHGVRPGANKHYMISVDAHLMPPAGMFRKRMDAKWHDKLPRVELRDGVRYILQDGARPAALVDIPVTGEDAVRMKSGATLPDPEREDGEDGSKRIADQIGDGVDGEVIFPNGSALMMWSSPDTEFVKAQCRAWNDWAWEICAPHQHRCNPAAALAPADIAASVAEIRRVAKLGYRVLTLPSKPIFGAHDVAHLNYNLPAYDPMWAAIQDADLAVTFHVATGMDPRTARGNGGAIINYVVHALAPTIEPIVSICSSGVLDRFPRLRAGTIEANAGWIPWMLQAMDEAYKKHHMWIRPKLDKLPSEAFRSNCFASFGEDASAMIQAGHFGLEDNLMWANDYPHHEGSWPHSAEAIERTFAVGVEERARRKFLGFNAARIFRFDVPERYRAQGNALG